jgi:hypothetical protein
MKKNLVICLLISTIICLFLSSCVEQTKEKIVEIKSMIGRSPLGKHCDEKNQVICYSKSENSGFDCVKVEKPMCKQEEMIK